MANHRAGIAVNEEDAFQFMVRYLREGRRGEYPSYGYEFYLPNVMRDYLQSVAGITRHQVEGHLREVSPPFFAAAWELCRRGILRPGVEAYGGQATDNGASGKGSGGRRGSGVVAGPLGRLGDAAGPSPRVVLAARRGGRCGGGRSLVCGGCNCGTMVSGQAAPRL